MKRKMIALILGAIVMAFFLVLAVKFARPSGTEVPLQVPYSTFRNELAADHVLRVLITDQRIEGELSQPAQDETTEGRAGETRPFRTVIPGLPDPTLIPELQAQGVEITVRQTSSASTTWMPLVFGLVPLLLLLMLGYATLGRAQGGGMDVLGFRRSGAKVYSSETTPVTFDDVGGSEGPRAELREVVEFLKDALKFQRLGTEIPRGVLLIGPPGTGKTLLARAVAGEAGVPFFSISGSEFVEMFVGVGASRVRNLFRQAKAHCPCIIFVDEIDAIGRQRGGGSLGRAHEEWEQTLNQLLAEMDGFEPNAGVIVLAATNRPDILDPALLRPGRFDRRVVVDLPTLAGRLAILKLHARGKPLADDVDLEAVARGTPGFSGADLENLLNEAALFAARADKNWIENEDLEGARDKVMMGLERRSLLISTEERRCMAYHEAGHAVVAAVLPRADPLHKVTIVPRGRALGVTQQLPAEERHLYTREYLLDKLAVLMGGRAAEELALDTATSGAE
ncbi:MAG: ATP-dependent zinc metalloprotease FtsH, partial [Anaerolineae bacterium]